MTVECSRCLNLRIHPDFHGIGLDGRSCSVKRFMMHPKIEEGMKSSGCKHFMEKKMTCDFTVNYFQKEAHRIAKEHGFWETERNVGEQIALMHSELSEMLEAFRKDPTAPSEHVPEITCVAEEMADVVIRIMDTAEKYGIDLEQAIRLKTKFNDGRPYKNGKKF